MTIPMIIRRGAAILHVAILFAAGAARAQDARVPVLVPGLENYVLPGRPSTPPPAVPTVRATPIPLPTPTPSATAAPRITVSPRATPAPGRVVRPAPTPRPAPAAAPASAPRVAPARAAISAPVAVPDATPTPRPAPSAGPTSAAPTPAVQEPRPVSSAPQSGPMREIVLAVTALIVLAALGWLFFRRRLGRAERIDAPAAPPLPVPVAPPPPPPASGPAAPPPVFAAEPEPASAPRAWIEFDLRPIRAGTNLTSAAVDYELTVRNTGDGTATGIHVDIRLLSASAEQDAVLAALFAMPIDRPAIAPFDLPPGTEATLGGMAMAPRETLNAFTAQGRSFFVPVLALNALYRRDGGEGQTASAHVIGIEREGTAKMAPFRLDTGPRMAADVGQRIHMLAIMR